MFWASLRSVHNLINSESATFFPKLRSCSTVVNEADSAAYLSLKSFIASPMRSPLRIRPNAFTNGIRREVVPDTKE